MAVDERVHEGWCGWAACANALPALPAGRKEGSYQVRLREKAVYRVERPTFCCAQCALASARLLQAVRNADQRRDCLDDLKAEVVKPAGEGADEGVKGGTRARGAKGATKAAKGGGRGKAMVAQRVAERPPARAAEERARARGEARGAAGAVEGYVPRGAPGRRGSEERQQGGGKGDKPIAVETSQQRDKERVSEPPQQHVAEPSGAHKKSVIASSLKAPPPQTAAATTEDAGQQIAAAVATIDLEYDEGGGAPTAYLTMVSGGGGHVTAGAADAGAATAGGHEGGVGSNDDDDEDELPEDYPFEEEDESFGGGGARAGGSAWWNSGNAGERGERAAAQREGFTALWVAIQAWAGDGESPLVAAGATLPPPVARSPAEAERGAALATAVGRSLVPLARRLRLPLLQVALEARVGALLAALDLRAPPPVLGSREWALVTALLVHAAAHAGGSNDGEREQGAALRAALEGGQGAKALCEVVEASELGAGGRYRLLLQELVGMEAAIVACERAGLPLK